MRADFAFDEAWMLAQRPPKNALNPRRPYAHLVEPECAADGRVVDVATIFLTNRECPFRCLMCDLWQNTLDDCVPDGAIPEQIAWALAHLPPADHIKLYNSGNFFDTQAIPRTDWARIAELTADFSQVIIENHPRLVNDTCLVFNDLLEGSLEVAMGLETVHPDVLPRLNKHMTLGDFERATTFLTQRGIAVRAFILLRPPFLSEAEGIAWAKRSLDFAFDVGVSVCAVIPTRTGNGALDGLAQHGLFAEPKLASLETVMAYGLAQNRGRVFADLWDLARFSGCPICLPARRERLHHMNLQQRLLPEISCDQCDETPG